MITDTLGERIFLKLKDDILSGFYSPGTRLRYEEISTRLDISITPIKEALLKLEREGLTVSNARKGTFVAVLTEDDIIEYSHIRFALESLAIELACKKKDLEPGVAELRRINCELQVALDRMDPLASVKKDIEFHQTLVGLSGSSRLIQTMNQLPLTNFFTLMGRQNLIVEHKDSVVRMHEEIIKEIENRNARKVKALLKRNTLNVYYDAMKAKLEQ